MFPILDPRIDTYLNQLEAKHDDPVLLEAVDSGRTVALALFNRVRHWPGHPVLFSAERCLLQDEGGGAGLRPISR